MENRFRDIDWERRKILLQKFKEAGWKVVHQIRIAKIHSRYHQTETLVDQLVSAVEAAASEVNCKTELQHMMDAWPLRDSDGEPLPLTSVLICKPQSFVDVEASIDETPSPEELQKLGTKLRLAEIDYEKFAEQVRSAYPAIPEDFDPLVPKQDDPVYPYLPMDHLFDFKHPLASPNPKVVPQKGLFPTPLTAEFLESLIDS